VLRFEGIVTLKKEQWESFLEINEQLLKKCRELQEDMKKLTARNEYLENRLRELQEQTSTEPNPEKHDD
jgi:hypothetical protein